MAVSTNLGKAQGNSASTTLSSSISDTDTSFPLTSDTNFDGEGYIIVDEGTANEEVCYATGKVGSSLTVTLANRGLEGTSAVGHDAGATVKGIMTAGMWNNLITQIGSATLDSNGNEIVKYGETASAVNEVTITNAATGAFPTISATGEADTGIDFENSEGEEILKLDAIASAVNELTIKNAATTNPAEIAASGGDSNISIKLTPKGTGNVQTTGEIRVPNAKAVTSRNAADSADLAMVQTNASNQLLLGENDLRPTRFVVVSGPSGWHYDSTAGAAKTSFTDVDVSSVVSARAFAIVYRYLIEQNNGTEKFVFVQKNGEGGSGQDMNKHQMYTSGVEYGGTGVVELDASMIFEYKQDVAGGTDNACQYRFAVVGYWEYLD